MTPSEHAAPARVWMCAGFSDAEHGHVCNILRPLASEKRQGTKSREVCSVGSAGSMGNWRQHGRLGDAEPCLLWLLALIGGPRLMSIVDNDCPRRAPPPSI